MTTVVDAKNAGTPMLGVGATCVDSQEVTAVCAEPHATDCAALVPALGSFNETHVRIEDSDGAKPGMTQFETQTDSNTSLQKINHQTMSSNGTKYEGSLDFNDTCESGTSETNSECRILQEIFADHDETRTDQLLLVPENTSLKRQHKAGKAGVTGCSKLEKPLLETRNNWHSDARHINVSLDCLKNRVVVTGAGGFIGSWIVKLLLKRGYHVRGTLRNTDYEKTAHLRSLEGAGEKLELVRADILHLPSVLSVVEGCKGVFHTACPVIQTIRDPEAQMIRPAVDGTLNVLKACSQAHVMRIVMTSSIGAVYMNPNRPAQQEVDESCWSDETHLRDNQEWYCLAKLMAERSARDYADTHDVNLVCICPAITLGTMLQPTMNQSTTHIHKYLNGSTSTYANLCQAYVDVKDAAKAHILAFETGTASGRYLCSKWSLHRGHVVEALARMYPQYPIPTRCKDEIQPKKVPLRFCNKRIENLGLQFTSFEQTLRDAVSSLQVKGFLPSNVSFHNLDDDHLLDYASNCTASEINLPTITGVKELKQCGNRSSNQGNRL